jgi:hypothetical protein
MQKRIVPFLALVFCDGCFLFNPIDPCAEGSPLQQDPKVAADCQQCNMSPCPDDGETGEDPPSEQVTVAAADHRYAFDGVTVQSVKDQLAVPGGLVEIDRIHPECGADWVDSIYSSSYRHYDCGLNWGGHPAFDWMDNNCVACGSAGGIDRTPQDNTGAWPTCPSNTSPALMGAWEHENDPTCTPGEVDPSTYACAEGHVQIWDAADPWSHAPANNWTCRCPDGVDSQCQPGAVCEAGWRKPYPAPILMPGLLVPTICTWDLGDGDANGVAPEGPVVYGLDAWEDGIVLTTRLRGTIGVRVTPSFMLVLDPAAWNDDQRFDVTTGELTYCGEDALCDWLGLTDGDRLRIPRSDGSELLFGKELALVVEHVDGSTTTFAVSIEFDGDLSD